MIFMCTYIMIIDKIDTTLNVASFLIPPFLEVNFKNQFVVNLISNYKTT